MIDRVSFSVPTRLGGEAEAAAAAITRGEVGADGPNTRRAEELIAERTGTAALLSASGTDALLLAMLLLDLEPGDEVIVPGFTFVSCALVVALRGATPVFADIDPVTLNLAPASVAAAMGPRTRAVMPVHYGGVAADLDALVPLAATHGAVVVEDAAHGYTGRHRGRPLGSVGELGALSFDYQKNVQAGEAGALLSRIPEHAARARTLAGKGTNRHAFLEGQVDKYTWIDLGGHLRPADYVAAALVPQLERVEEIQTRRAALWSGYAEGLADWAGLVGARLPVIPEWAESSHHIFWIVLPSLENRRSFMAWMDAAGIPTPFQFQSLAHTPAGERYGRSAGTPVSDAVAERLVRLPLHHALTDDELARVIRRATDWRPERSE